MQFLYGKPIWLAPASILWRTVRVLIPAWVGMNLMIAEIGSAYMVKDHRRLESVDEISYEETLDYVENPGMGFYSPVYVHFQENGNAVPETSDPLIHFRMDLAEFSGAYHHSSDKELSEDALKCFEETLEMLEEDQRCAILRFSYDPWFSGKNTYEPSLEMILRHQEQLGEVISRHGETVVSVECGLFGKWGEMHGSKACTQENFNRVIDKWLDVLPESIPISVRTPSQYAGWCGIGLNELAAQVTTPGQKEYRVGIYDDGYMASESDLGTYVNRDQELTWLSNQAKHTLFGGEAGVTRDNMDEIGLTVSYLEKEAFLTHLTYLNGAWNQQTIDVLKQETYEGSDPRYQGRSGYEYVRNHFGYRFVVRGVRMTKEVPQGWNLILETDVENVGFANLVKPKELSLLIVGNGVKYHYPVMEWVENSDPTKWDSQRITSFCVSAFLPEDAPLGEYQVYLAIATPSVLDEEKKPIYAVRLANDGEVWNDELRANFLGSFQVTDKPKKLEWTLENGYVLK